MRDRSEIVTLTGIAVIRLRHKNGAVSDRLRFVGRDKFEHRVETYLYPSRHVLLAYASAAKTPGKKQLANEALENLCDITDDNTDS